MSAADYGIPHGMRPGLERYLVQHIMPGDFLCAVLRNDLKEAVRRADDINQLLLPNYVRYLRNEAPASAWGSVENFESWLTRLPPPEMQASEPGAALPLSPALLRRQAE